MIVCSIPQSQTQSCFFFTFFWRHHWTNWQSPDKCQFKTHLRVTEDIANLLGFKQKLNEKLWCRKIKLAKRFCLFMPLPACRSYVDFGILLLFSFNIPSLSREEPSQSFHNNLWLFSKAWCYEQKTSRGILRILRVKTKETITKRFLLVPF